MIRMRWIAAAAAVAGYFATAAYLRASYVDIAPRGKAVVQLLRPFEVYNHAYIGRLYYTKRFDGVGDDPAVEGDDRSPLLVFEGSTRLGPGHSSFADIYHLGAGRFAHWRGTGVTFSATDNSDPNANGRAYFAVLP